MINIPQYIADLESLKISLNRVQEFLLVKDMEEKSDTKEEEKEELNLNTKSVALEYKNCNFVGFRLSTYDCMQLLFEVFFFLVCIV